MNVNFLVFQGFLTFLKKNIFVGSKDFLELF